MTEPDPLAAAQALTESFDAMTTQMARLKRSDNWLRRIVTGLVASLVLDIAITAGLGWDAVRTDSVQSASHASLITACRAANVNRVQDIAIWNRLLRLPAVAKPAARIEAAELKRLVRAKDRQRDCAALYRK